MGGRDGNRFLHILEAPGDVQNYKLFRLDGTEAISTAEGFRLTVRAEGEVPPASEWLNASITFSLGMSDDTERRINGRCARFEHLYHKGSYVEFAILVEPAFAELRLTRDRRMFTDKSHREVVETILREHAITFDSGRYGASATRPYIVQQDESDFDFISRLIADEGVFYYFRFDEGAAPYKHRMYLAGDSAGYYDGDPFQLSFRRDHLLRGLHDLQMGYDSAPAAVMTHDYDFTKPGDLSPIKAPSKLDWAARRGHVYHWGSDYTDPAAGRDRAKLRIEGAESAAVVMRGTGSYVAFAPAARFQVDDKRLDPRERRIVIRAVSHDAFDPYSRAEGEPFYRQSFEAQPSTQSFRPKRSAVPVTSRGPQTAVVVDQTDPDGHGRVKIRFHWDRNGASTCWVRVLQQWAGDGVGAQFIPRPGMEVLIDFIDGRPDRPVVVGSLYNGRNKHAFAVPANLTQAGFRTYGDGGLVNELLFEDKSGGEEIYLHSGRDYRRIVNQHEMVDVAQTHSTKAASIDVAAGDRIDIRADKMIVLHVGGSKIVIDGSGIWLDGSQINLNSGNAPAVLPIQDPRPATKAPPVNAGGGGGGGGGGGSNAPSGGPAAAPAPSVAANGPPVAAAAPPGSVPLDIDTKLGQDVAALAGRSPALMRDMTTLRDANWSVDYGPAGGGTFANRDAKTITIDANHKGNAPAVTQLLSHEVGHALYSPVQDFSSKQAYLRSALADEGAATFANIRTQREVMAAGGVDIGIAGNSANFPAYNAAFDQFGIDKDSAKARETIGAVYGAGEKTSTTGQTYADYYGDWYDRAFPSR